MTSLGPADGTVPALSERAVTTDRPRPRVDRPLVLLVAGQILSGIVIGLLWLAWSPRTIAYLIPGAGSQLLTIPDESENQIAGDGRFLVLGAVTGLVVGLLAWFLVGRRRGPVPMLSIAVGGLLSSALAAAVGHLLSGGSNSGAVRSIIHPPLSLHSHAMVFVQPFVAVLVYVVIAGLDSDPSLRGEPPAVPPADVDTWPSPPN